MIDVVRIEKSIVDLFVRQKHYSRRASTFWAGYGLLIDDHVEGVVVYGQPMPPVQKHAFKDRDFRLYELTRLVVQTKMKNAASILIGRSLKMLQKEQGACAVVSYADSEWGHAGIVYQATNWTYTGATVSHDHNYIVNGKRVHPISLRDAGISNPKQWAKENGIETVKPMQKHRYFTFLGTKAEKKAMLDKLTYKVVGEYPKMDQIRYDDGEILNVLIPTRTLYELALMNCLDNHL